MTQKNVSYTTLILAIIATVFICLLVYIKFDNIVQLFSSTQEQQNVLEKNDFEKGQDITLTGLLEGNGDVRYYTHTLQTQDYGSVGIKSKLVNLSAYKGNVEVAGTIAGYNEDTIIVDVETVILMPDQSEEQQQTGDTQSNDVYLRNAAIYLPKTFFEKYTLSDKVDRSNIIFSDNAGTTYAVNYFPCTSNGGNTDCAKLQKTFTDSSSKSFTTTNGMTFYKLAEVSSWFTTNDSLFGYFFNDMTEATVIELSKDIVFPTIKSIEQQVVPELTNICSDGIHRLGSVDDYSLTIKSGILHLVSTGMVGAQQASCDVTIDYTQPRKAVLTQFSVEDVVDQSSTEQDTSIQEEPKTPQVIKTQNPFDPNVKQFPINLEKPFVFNSNRSHSILFPSMNISFAGENTDTDLGFAGVKCYAQINVVSYPNKDLLKTNPSVILYECSRVPSDITFPTEYIVYPVVEGKTFIIHVLDGSRREFANNISIQQH